MVRIYQVEDKGLFIVISNYIKGRCFMIEFDYIGVKRCLMIGFYCIEDKRCFMTKFDHTEDIMCYQIEFNYIRDKILLS